MYYLWCLRTCRPSITEEYWFFNLRLYLFSLLLMKGWNCYSYWVFTIQNWKIVRKSILSTIIGHHCVIPWLYPCFLVHHSFYGEAYTNIEGVFRFIRCSFQAPPTPWWYKSRKWWTSGQPCWISFYLRFNQIGFNPPKKIGQKCIGNQTNGKMGIKQNQTKSNLTQVSRLEKNE